MNIVPENKLDIEACEKLVVASDVDVINNLAALLDWTQDINWPVAAHVNQRLSGLGVELVEPLREILEGEDGTWKYFTISHLFPKLRAEVLGKLMPDLQRLAASPTSSDISEEVNLAAKEVLNGAEKKV